jgi:hypothetical protein
VELGLIRTFPDTSEQQDFFSLAAGSAIFESMKHLSIPLPRATIAHFELFVQGKAIFVGGMNASDWYFYHKLYFLSIYCASRLTLEQAVIKNKNQHFLTITICVLNPYVKSRLDQSVRLCLKVDFRRAQDRRKRILGMRLP